MQIDQTNYTDNKGIANYIPETNARPGIKVAFENVIKTEAMSVSESGNVNMAEATYGRPEQEKKTAVEELTENEGKSVEDRRNQMAVLSNTMSPEDYKKAQESGFALSETDSATIITVTDKIKAVLAKAGVDISAYGDSLSMQELEEITGSASLAAQIVSQLQAYDLPVTSENLEDVQKAYEKANELQPLSEAAMRYLIHNQKEPTIENIYKAEYSGTEGTNGNYAVPLSSEDFYAMQEQIEQVIQRTGYPVNKDTMADCKWLLDNDLALTKENLVYYEQLKALSGHIERMQTEEQDSDFIFSSMAEAVAEGKSPLEGMLVSGFSHHSRAEYAMYVIAHATDEDLSYCIDRGEPLTVENLSVAMENRKSGVVTQNSAALLTARRQLEETRLAMSAQANYALLKKGIAIDTEPLVELVDDLKDLENNYYKELLEKSGVEASSENVSVFADTSHIVEELKSCPAYVLEVSSESDTLHSLHQSGSALKEDFARANESYEALMTAPRKDMGDSIQKAFQNVDDILNDLNLETSEANRRAVRILAYNNTEINEDNIYAIKAKDEEVQRAFANMTPKTTLELIRRNVNPLDMDIRDLNRAAEEVRREIGEEEQERFSKYLWKLEQNREITREERDSYIGIYRLIAQVEKTDGAVIGSLINQGADITMRNLLTAVRSGKKGAMDYEVSDDFDGVAVHSSGRRIDDQIAAAYQQNCVRDVMEQMSPETLQSIGQENWENMTPEQLKEALAQSRAESEAGEQEAAAGNPKAEGPEELYMKEQMSVYEQVSAAPEEVYTYLERNDIPNSVQNILAVQQMLQEPGQMFRTLWNDKDASFDRKKAIQEIKDLALERFGKAMGDPEEMEKAQEALAETAEHAMDDMIIEQENVTSVDVRMLRLANRQFSICARQAKEENYMIPMETADGVTGVNLKIIRSKEQKGWVDVLFKDSGMGKVAASFEAKEHGISGLIVTDNEETRQLLAGQLGILAEHMQGERTEPVELRVALIPDLSLEHYAVTEKRDAYDAGNGSVRKSGDSADGSTREIGDGQTKKNTVQTKRLYHVAESFIRTIGEISGSPV